MMYLIPKNIKVKREIFKGFGMIEIIALGFSFVIGFLIQNFVQSFHIKIFLFFVFPLVVFLLLLPLPNGATALTILKKYIKYKTNQKNYKYK